MTLMEFSSKQKTVLVIAGMLLISGGTILIAVKPSKEEIDITRQGVDKLKIAFRGEAASSTQGIHELSPEEQAYQTEFLKVDLNTATADEIVKIKGVGPSMAKKIIDYRNKTPFKSVEDLKNISGVGEKTFIKMAMYARVGKPGENLYVVPAEGTSSNEIAAGELININTATAIELQKLPRIGPSTAQSIIKYRDEHGRFKRKTEITNVPRIGEALYNSIKDKITVENVYAKAPKKTAQKPVVKKPVLGANPISEKINVNTAGVDELAKLPKIGKKTAEKIIEYRSKNGKFRDIKDVMNVSGISVTTFDSIKDKITVN